MGEKRKIPQELFIVFAVCIILLILGLTGVFRPVRGLMEKTVVIPIKEKIYNWQRAFKKDLDGCQLKDENQIAELKTKIASLAEENLSQKKLLSAPLPKNWQFITTKVVGISNEELTINIGEADGVKVGQAGLFGSTYLGKVGEVSQSLAKIRLPSFIDDKMSVRIVSPDKELNIGKGLLIGKGTGKMKIEQIFSSEEVTSGNLVVVDVEGGNLLVGEVTEVTQNIGEPFKTAGVKLLYNPEELNTIFLIRGKI